MDARGLPWGVQWEIARLISLGQCSWDDISMSALDVLRTEGLPPPDPDSPTSESTPAVLNARLGPYIEDLFRWKKHTFGNQRPSKEILATVRFPPFLRPVIHTNLCSAWRSHLGKNSTGRFLPSSGMDLQAAWAPRLKSGAFTAARCPFACGHN